MRTRMLQFLNQTSSQTGQPLRFTVDEATIHWEHTRDSGSATHSIALQKRNGPGDSWAELSSLFASQGASANVALAISGLKGGECRIVETINSSDQLDSVVYIVT